MSIKGFVTLEFNDNLDLLKMNNFTNASFVEFSVVKNKQFDDDLKSNGYTPE